MKPFRIKLLYLYKFISQCLPIYAFYTLLFLQRGLTIASIALLIALWSVFTILLEVPSGVLADRWSRRNMLVVAALLQGLCYVLWYFSHSFWMFALGFALWAMAGAFTSGTEESLLYDNLKSDGAEGSFAKIYGRAQFFSSIGTVVGLASAGILVRFISIQGLSLLSAGICFANALCAMQLREKNLYGSRAKEPSTSAFATLRGALAFIRSNGGALFSLLFLVLVVCIGDYLDEFDALIINDFQVNPLWVSVILMVRYGFSALGDILAPIVQRHVPSARQIILLSGAAFVLLLSFALLWSPFALLLFGLACMVMAITQVLLMHALQSEIAEEGRATVLSFYGMGQNIAMVCFSLVYGYLAEMVPLQHVYLLISIYGLLAGLLFLLCFRRQLRNSPKQHP